MRCSSCHDLGVNDFWLLEFSLKGQLCLTGVNKPWTEKWNKHLSKVFLASFYTSLKWEVQRGRIQIINCLQSTPYKLSVSWKKILIKLCVLDTDKYKAQWTNDMVYAYGCLSLPHCFSRFNRSSPMRRSSWRVFLPMWPPALISWLWWSSMEVWGPAWAAKDPKVSSVSGMRTLSWIWLYSRLRYYITHASCRY